MNPLKYPFLDLATVNSPYMEQLRSAADSVVRSGRYIGGPEVETFERNIATLCQTPCAIGVGNGLDALRLILMAWQQMGMLSPGDGVVVPGNTFIASVLAIVQAGLRPVLIDPDPLTHCITGHGVNEACTGDPGIRVVMPVHLYGKVAWDAEMASAVMRHSLLVVEDAAQSI